MAVWITAFIAITVAFMVLAGFVLPRLLFFTRYDINGSNDRGIRKIDDEDMKSLVFEPSAEARKYIESYALTDRDGKRTLVCKLNKSVSFLDYDVVIFNADNKVVSVFNVKEDVSGGEYTHAVELPSDTDYISLLINEADGERFTRRVVKNVSATRILAFLLCSAVLIALAVFGLKVCCAYMFAGLFRESFLVLGKSNAVTGVIVAAAVVVDIILTFIAFAVRRATSKGRTK